MQSEDKEKLSKEIIEKHLENLSRIPFKSILATLLKCEPTADEVKKFAAKWPDRYAQTVTQFAKLSGFPDRLEIQGSFSTDISQMSDMELLQKMAELEDKLKIMKDTTEDNESQ